MDASHTPLVAEKAGEGHEPIQPNVQRETLSPVHYHQEKAKERIQAALDDLRRHQSATATPNHSRRPFHQHEDHYLIAATLEGLPYPQIAQNLTLQTPQHHRSPSQCRHRLRNLSAQSIHLPQSWADATIDIPPSSQLISSTSTPTSTEQHLITGNYADTLLPYERAELVLYVFHRTHLYTPYIFRSYISAVLLRRSLDDLEDLWRDYPQAFEVEVEHALETRITRRGQAERQWGERVGRQQGWSYRTRERRIG